MRRLLLACGATIVALLALSSAAFGHAYVTGSEPFRDEIFRTGQPERVVFSFNEPVEAEFGAVRVFDTSAERVDQTRIIRPEGDRTKLGVELEPGLPDGSYTATYRLVSTDGHVITGGILFHLGERSPDGALAVSDAVQGDGGGPTISTAFAVVRALDAAALAAAIGSIAFLLLCWLPALRAAAGGDGRWRGASEAYARRASLLLLGAVNLGIATAMLGILVQGSIVSGQSFWAALESNVVRDVLATRFGTVWGAKLLVWLALGGVLVASARALPVMRPVALGADGHVLDRPGRARIAALAVPAAVLACLPALAGHASSQDPAALLIPTNVAHVAAMSIWIGGLLALLVVVPAATGALEGRDRSRLLATVLRRFSPLALAAVAVLAVSGTVQALAHLENLGQLVTTGYGRAILVKVALLGGLIALGLRQRRRTLPRLAAVAEAGEAPGAAGGLLRRTVRTEVALVAAVLAVTGALVGYAPPASLAGAGAAGETVRVEQTVGPLDVTTTVDPARLGTNRLDIVLTDAASGEPFRGTKSITAEASLPAAAIGPLPIALREAGPGHYVADAFELTLAGDWEIEIVDRVSDFDQYTTTVTVPVG